MGRKPVLFAVPILATAALLVSQPPSLSSASKPKLRPACDFRDKNRLRASVGSTRRVYTIPYRRGGCVWLEWGSGDAPGGGLTWPRLRVRINRTERVFPLPTGDLPRDEVDRGLCWKPYHTALFLFRWSPGHSYGWIILKAPLFVSGRSLTDFSCTREHFWLANISVGRGVRVSWESDVLPPRLPG